MGLCKHCSCLASNVDGAATIYFRRIRYFENSPFALSGDHKMTIYTSRGSMSAVPRIDRLHDQLGRVSVEIIQIIPVTSPNLIIRVCVNPCPFRMESDQYSDSSRVGKKDDGRRRKHTTAQASYLRVTQMCPSFHVHITVPSRRTVSCGNKPRPSASHQPR